MAYFRCGGGVPSSVKTLPTYKTASGSVATFETDMTENLISCVADIVATQSGSGTPSPSNPRPIQTYTSLNLSHSGSDTSNPTVYNIPFGQTVANGVIDITTGKLTITWVEFDMGSLTWFYLASGSSVAPYFYANLSNLKPWSTIIPVLTPIYKSVKRNPSEFIDNTICGELSQIQIKDSRFTDAQSFKSAMNGIIAIYELATPIEIQLDSITLQALLNENNIWCDTGDISAKYILSVGEALRQG